MLFKVHFLRQFVPYVSSIGSPWFRRKLLEFWPSKDVQKLVDIVDIMHEQSVEVFNAKKEMLAEGEDAAIRQVGKGKDILSILREFNCITRFAANDGYKSEGKYVFRRRRPSPGGRAARTTEVGIYRTRPRNASQSLYPIARSFSLGTTQRRLLSVESFINSALIQTFRRRYEMK